jgi:hypothetical protein
MAADEQQAQDVVAIVLGVELIGERCLGIIVIRQDFLGRQASSAVSRSRK